MPQVIGVDVERCVGCHSCELQCAIAHSIARELIAATGEDPRPVPRVRVVAIGGARVPLQCQHCDEAACITVCPVGAMRRDDPESPVLVDWEKCTGCGFCVVVCPFGAITHLPQRRKVVKCDLCVERLGDGEEPACVVACPTYALALRDRAEVGALQRDLSPPEIEGAAPTHSGAEGLQTDGGKTPAAACRSCGAPIIRRATMERLAAKTGLTIEQLSVCPACRRLARAARLARAGALV